MAKKNITSSMPPKPELIDSVIDLHKGELKFVQNYVRAGIELPYSFEQMSIKWEMTIDEAKTFTDIQTVFAVIHTHCDEFETHIYPDSVQLAHDIVLFRDKATKYFRSIIKVGDRYDDGTYSEDRATELLTKYLTKLLKMSQDFSAAANDVSKEMADFVKVSTVDKSLLDPLKDTYEKKYEGKHGIIWELNERLVDLGKLLKEAQDAYEYDVKVAATTPTYAWIFPGIPVGLIAAAVVAGVYGKRATDALDDIHRNMKEINEKNEEVRQAQKLMTHLHMASSSLDGISTKLDQALPVLNKIKKAWDVIAADLAAVLATVKDEDIADLDMVAAEADSAIDEWNRVAYIAYNYERTAYMDVTDFKEVKSRIDAEEAYSPYKDADPEVRRMMDEIEKDIAAEGSR